MARSKNKIKDSNAERTKPGKKKLKKFYPFLAGNTRECHKTIVDKLKHHGAKKVKRPEDSEVVVVFCPIVSRFETDMDAALNELKLELPSSPKIIMAAMHHTHRPDYTFPSRNEYVLNGERVPVVHCLFHETRGLLRCPANEDAFHRIRKEMGIKKHSDRCSIL